MLYYPPGRILLLLSGLALITFGLGGVTVAIVEITAISYSSIPLLSLPDSLPNISWMAHYWLALFVAIGGIALGVIAVKFRQNADRAKFLLIVLGGGLALYIAFFFLSAYHEADLRGGMWRFPIVFTPPILSTLGATLNFFAQRKFVRQNQVEIGLQE
jgi:hypothetical protein